MDETRDEISMQCPHCKQPRILLFSDGGQYQVSFACGFYQMWQGDRVVGGVRPPACQRAEASPPADELTLLQKQRRVVEFARSLGFRDAAAVFEEWTGRESVLRYTDSDMLSLKIRREDGELLELTPMVHLGRDTQLTGEDIKEIDQLIPLEMLKAYEDAQRKAYEEAERDDDEEDCDEDFA